MSTIIDETTIINRGYLMGDEYKQFVADSKPIRLLSKFQDGKIVGGFCFRFKSPEYKNNCIIASDLSSFDGPRTVAGMVGYFDPETGELDHPKTIELFKQCGEASVEYANKEMDNKAYLVKKYLENAIIMSAGAIEIGIVDMKS